MARASATRLALIAGALLILGTAGALALRHDDPGSFGIPVAHIGAITEAAPLCPWREPEKDLAALFPDGRRWTTETRILSGARLELARRLGRQPSTDEHALHVNRVFGADGAELGAIIARRVKGEYGAIELVVGLEPDGHVRGVRIQRQREPELIARALTSPTWLRRLRRSGGDADALPAALVSALPSAARASGQAVVDGVRSTRILYDVARTTSAPVSRRHH